MYVSFVIVFRSLLGLYQYLYTLKLFIIVPSLFLPLFVSGQAIIQCIGRHTVWRCKLSTGAAQGGCREGKREAVCIVSIITLYVCVVGHGCLNSVCYPQECVLLAPALTVGSALRRVISFVSARKGSRECAASMVSL